MDAKFSPVEGQKEERDSPSATSRDSKTQRGYRFPGKRILKGYRSFQDVIVSGSVVASKPLRCFFIIEKESAGCRVGFTTRKTRTKVERNKIRRRLREAFRQECHPLDEACRKKNVRLSCVIMFVDTKSRKQQKYTCIKRAIQQIILELTRHVMTAEFKE
ncbi:MAG: hypothetical protein GXO82_01450 [Chlorobi bacterium]|nr:hypothetical protein [Chlorobiota bacterium]